MKNLILCGYKSCGKTTIARNFSKKFNYKFIDTDQLVIEEFYKMTNKDLSISHIHKFLGEDDFRKLESKVTQNITSSKLYNLIIATGGGVILDPHNRSYLKSLGQVIYIKIDAETIIKRILGRNKLPTFIDPLNPKESARKYISNREGIYQEFADYVLEAENKNIKEIIEEIKNGFGIIA